MTDDLLPRSPVDVTVTTGAVKLECCIINGSEAKERKAAARLPAFDRHVTLRGRFDNPADDHVRCAPCERTATGSGCRSHYSEQIICHLEYSSLKTTTLRTEKA